MRMSPAWKLVAILVTLCLPHTAFAQESQEQAPKTPSGVEEAKNAFQGALERIWSPQSRLTDGPQVRSAFRDVIAEARNGVVRVRCKGKTVALGGVVGPNGWVLTKASQLNGDARVRLRDGRQLDAKLVGVDREYDLAMLKVDATGLDVLPLDQTVTPVDGDWLATVGSGRDPVAVGVLSVSPRTIPHRPGFLGIRHEQGDGGVAIVNVLPDTGAAEAGLLINDLILRINETPTPTVNDLRKTLAAFSPGDHIELGIRRGEKNVSIRAMLAGRNFQQSRSEYQNNLGSTLSKRRFSFPSAIQHDTVLSATECGGPIVNLDGKVIGFNIARAGRTETFAVPTAVLRTLLYDLMSGNLAPEDG